MNPITKNISYLYEPYQPSLSNKDYVLKKTGKSYEDLRNLKSDPHIWSSIQQRKSGVLSMDWKIYDKDEESNLVIEVKELLNKLGAQQLIRDILEAPLFGYQPLEIEWMTEGGRIYPESVNIVKQENFTFDTKGIIKYYPKDKFEPVPIPDYKILMPRYEATRINPFGQSLLTKCYRIVQFKNGVLRNWYEYTDKYGLPFLVGKYNRGIGQEEIDKLKNQIVNMIQDGVILAPDDIAFDNLEMKGQSSKELFNGLINFCNTEISKAMLSQTLTTELNIGSYAAANIHYKVKREVIESDIRILESTINQLIGWYLELNYGQTEGPKFLIIFTNADNTAQVERDEKLSKMGVKLSRDYFKRQYELAETDIEQIKETNNA